MAQWWLNNVRHRIGAYRNAWLLSSTSISGKLIGREKCGNIGGDMMINGIERRNERVAFAAQAEKRTNKILRNV